MRRIIGTIGATLAVAAALGVGLVLTAKALPQVAAAQPLGAIERSGTGEKADILAAVGSPVLNDGGVPQISPANTYV